MITADVEDIFELTPLQHGMLFHSIAEPESAMYFEQICFELPGLLDVAKFQHAWNVLVDRHQVLRTSFFWEDLDKPLQVVHRRASIKIACEDWAGLPADAVDARLRDFLTADRETWLPLDRAPLMRISLFRINPRCHRFVASFHHALLDGWSLGNLFSEFRSVYEALLRNGPYPLRPIRPYGDYLRWLQEQDPTVAETHWRRILAGYHGPAPLAMLDAADGAGFVEVEAYLGEFAVSRLNEVASELKVTMNTIVQGVWGVLLGRYTGEGDVVFGAVVSGRPPSLPGVESMVGLFINTIPVRAHANPERSVAEYLEEIQAQQAVGRDHAHVSLVDIQGWSDVPRGAPLFNTLLIFENQPMASSSNRSPSDDAATATAFERTNYPITILISPGTRLGIKVQCLNGSMDVATSIANHVVTLLEAVGRNPHRQLASLSMHTAEDYHKLLRMARGPQVDREFVGLHELFVRQVAIAPTATAVSGAGHTWNYDELMRRSGAVAARLADLGVERGDVVAVFAPRSPVLAAMLLGVLHVGAAFLPLDRSSPLSRVEFMLSDAGARVVLTSSDLAPLLRSVDIEVLVVDDSTTSAARVSPAPAGPDDLAYVIYTSGSTGRPKGVMQTHGATVNRFHWMWDAFPFALGEVACQKTAPTFVDAIWEILGPLLRGMPLRFIDDQTAADPDRFVDELARGRVTRLLVVPSLLRVLIESHDDLSTRLSELALCVCSGESLAHDLVATFKTTLPRATLVNLYGSSEVAGDVTVAVLGDGSTVDVPIGTPIDNVTTYVLDDSLQPVAVGVPGEIHVGGAALARGYLGQPGLTAERFVPDPFGDGGRLFRTGDLARWRPNGQLEFLGRRDHQVKLRGIRVELGEVEAALVSCSGVEHALVAVQEEHTPRAHLVADVTTTDRSVRPATIRAAVAEHLPDVLVPAVIQIVDTLPRLSNGKLNRLAVKARQVLAEGADRPQRPTSETERRLAALWQEVLGVPISDRRASFFALGGHSLTVMQLGSRIRRELGVHMPLRELFDAATLQRQASRIDATRRDASRTGDQTIRRLARSTTTVRHEPQNREGRDGG